MTAAGARLTISNVSHAYAGVPALADVSFEVPPGDLTALLGPSGCGKTTLLRIIAGFFRQTQGSVLVNGAPIDDVPAAKRNVGIVFQNYALFPHLDVARNVGYGLRAQGATGPMVEARVDEMLRLVKMEKFAKRLPGELSGGQQQRVALARALAVSPRIVLLDEPFSALDKALRLDMQIEVKSLLKQSGVTSIIVTHDQEEALSMADRIVVLNQGRIEQIGGPSELYDAPRSLFVNTFIGHTNLIAGRLIGRDGAALAIDLPGLGRLSIPTDKDYPAGQALTVTVRPENFALDASGPIEGTVRQILPLGPVDVIEVALAAGPALKVSLPHAAGGVPLSPGAALRLSVRDPAGCGVFSTAAAPAAA
ncbi:MAG: ABC transporter ATP-binding protein [Azospirillum sp.]|nr:ABC transporter ATP-binding protein [Azospirillum sp.]MCA3264998.1 ABC transporter ATP-binding protein [Azospirillum sp.]MCZ8122189.1 ABC transporter ATP-binding protein [Magnetospirillum sp.]